MISQCAFEEFRLVESLALRLPREIWYDRSVCRSRAEIASNPVLAAMVQFVRQAYAPCQENVCDTDRENQFDDMCGSKCAGIIELSAIDTCVPCCTCKRNRFGTTVGL